MIGFGIDEQSAETETIRTGFECWGNYWIDKKFPTGRYGISTWDYFMDCVEMIKAKPIESVPDLDQETGNIVGYELADSEYEKSDALNALQSMMVVHIWGHMEDFLKGMMPYLCVLQTSCAKLADAPSLYQAQYQKNGRPFSFDYDTFKKAYTIIDPNGVGSVKHYIHINDIRVLNNISKHAVGRYNPENKRHALSKSVKLKLGLNGLKKGRYDVEYRKLNINEYVTYCNEFARSMFDKIEQELKRNTL
ncbi:MAG: hypothetical protein FWE50_02940 [Alphaproteobacteria bacterium]|nr:hypothetical protein [Alphaproteobacteria bacterium]